MSMILRCAVLSAMILASACKPAADTTRNTAQPGTVKPGGNVSNPVGVAELKPSECNELGGTIKYDAQCPELKLSCRVETTSGTRQTCIDELDVAMPQ
jgi:hypothetical protein